MKGVNLENILRLEINLIAILVLLVILVSSFRRTKENEFTGSVLFYHILFSILFILLMDSLAWLLDGTPGTIARIGLYISDTLYYSIQFLPFATYLLYVDRYTHTDSQHLHSAYFYILVGLSVTFALMALSTPWTKFFFSIDNSNHYVRGPFFYVLTLANFIVGMYPMVLLIRRRESVSRRSFYILILYPIIPLVGGILQYSAYGNNMLWPSMSVSLLLIFINVQNRRIELDFLTGTFNRFSLGEYQSYLEKRAANGSPFSGIMLDLDGFKEINDRFGHSIGDDALVEASKILQKSVNRENFVARYGGDEFLIILDTSDRQELDEAVARIQEKFIESNSRQHRPYTLSVSIGSGVFDLKTDGNFDTFIHRLDLLMYKNKRRFDDPHSETFREISGSLSV
jgi:diguanylate cyclase (GGDEF)-like protein